MYLPLLLHSVRRHDDVVARNIIHLGILTRLLFSLISLILTFPLILPLYLDYSLIALIPHSTVSICRNLSLTFFIMYPNIIHVAHSCPSSTWDISGVILPSVLLALQQRRPVLLSLLFDAFGDALVSYFHTQDTETYRLPIGCHFGVTEFLQGCLTLAVQCAGEGFGDKRQGLGSSLETLEFLVKRGACDSGLQVALLKPRLYPLYPPPPLHSPSLSSSFVEGSTRPVLSISSDCLCPFLHLAVLQCSNFSHTTTTMSSDDEDDDLTRVGPLGKLRIEGMSSSLLSSHTSFNSPSLRRPPSHTLSSNLPPLHTVSPALLPSLPP